MKRRGGRWRYRIGQVLRRVVAALRSPDVKLAAEILSPQEMDLFQRQAPGDAAHALRVARLLKVEGSATRELLRAALLHDVGKAEGGLTLAHRTVIVLLRHYRPAWLGKLASPAPASWRYPFWVHLHHAEIGAEFCLAAGVSPEATALVRHHEAAPEDLADPDLCAGIMALAQADDRC